MVNEDITTNEVIEGLIELMDDRKSFFREPDSNVEEPDDAVYRRDYKVLAEAVNLLGGLKREKKGWSGNPWEHWLLKWVPLVISTAAIVATKA
jgi:hypothetical protein